MKYFLDTEFIEGFKKPIKWLPTIGNFNKPYHSIQLISIGIVAEDGQAYYAISNEFNPADASEWVMENVIVKLFYHNEFRREHRFNKRLKSIGKKNAEIRQELFGFFGCESDDMSGQIYQPISKPVEFYAYYADYDWVVFCSLFGTMMDLPKGFPMYCKDLKQTVDEEVDYLALKEDGYNLDKALARLKKHPKYPKQENEHNALDDAKWNFELYKFLTKL